YPWPGNLRELEAVVEQSLASTAGDPLGIDDLVLEGFALAPIDASIVGTLLPDGAEDAPVEPAEAVEAADSALPPPIGRAAFGEPRPHGEAPRGPDRQRLRDDDPGP